jgi:hypothetical protein
MSRFGAGIRRGVMAADQFTQIANGLFRDPGLSFKAKGIFGCISTHRTGWHVTLAALVRAGPDGRDAVRAGLSELQTSGYLVREQLRRENGTLGEIVYCITDRPANADADLAQAATGTLAAGPAGEPDHGFGAGIRRGVMAGDQFTQIANGLFRDPRLSFKAKGLFGLISTHRDGWRMTVADLTRRGRDQEAAVKSGLKELEQHGFLLRERERHLDGTLGVAAYFITDLPSRTPAAHHRCRVFHRWMIRRRLIGPLRTPTARRPTSRTPDPSVRATAAKPRARPKGRTSRTPQRPRQPRPWRTRCTRVSGCCSRGEPSRTAADRAGADRSGPGGDRDDGCRLQQRAAEAHHHRSALAAPGAYIGRGDHRRPPAGCSGLPTARHACQPPPRRILGG